MSSNNSPQLVSEAAAIVAAVVAVAEQSLFAWAEPASGDGADWPSGAWWRSSVRFDGPIAGRVTFTLTDGLARSLFAAFLGLEPDAPIADAALGDFLGEFANMSCGAWLTGLERPECFSLQAPEVGPADRPVAAGATAVVMVNDEPVVVHVAM